MSRYITLVVASLFITVIGVTSQAGTAPTESAVITAAIDDPARPAADHRHFELVSL